ncbi:hypothetical protein [Bacillus phage SWEP1]|nr:hypothetical protein [Bacillus phage SWEP1]
MEYTYEREVEHDFICDEIGECLKCGEDSDKCNCTYKPEEEMEMFKLNAEVKVEMVCGFELEGKIVDRTSAGDIWVERHSDKDWLLVSPDVDRVTIIEPVEEIPTPEANGFKSLTEIKAEIKEEISQLWCQDIKSVSVKVFNDETSVYDGYEELGRVECWDCEVQVWTENKELINVYFGQFFNEKDALKHARDMRTKLKRTFDIEDKVTVYSC